MPSANRLLEGWLRKGRFDDSGYVAGFELEAWLLDRNFFRGAERRLSRAPESSAGRARAFQIQYRLATLFSRIIVYFVRPLGVQSAAFAKLCPSITVECGKPGNIGNEMRAAELIEAALNLDHMNFRDLPAGTRLAELSTAKKYPLDVWAEDGSHVADLYLERAGTELRLKRSATPSMLTLDKRVIRQDCLCYLMERITLPDATAPAAHRSKKG